MTTPQGTAGLPAITRSDIGEAQLPLDQAMRQSSYIALRMFPVLEVSLQAGQYARVPLSAYKLEEDTERALSADYKSIGYTFDLYNYATRDHGLRMDIDVRHRRAFASILDGDFLAGQLTRDAVMAAFEKRVEAIVTANANTNAAAAAWTRSTGTPVSDVTAAVLAIRARTGISDTSKYVAQMSFPAFMKARQNAEVVEGVRQITATQNADINEQTMAAAMGIGEVIVSGNMVNTSDIPGTTTMGEIWPIGTCVVGVRDATPGAVLPCMGRTAHWGEDGSSIGGVFEADDYAHGRASWVRSRMDTDELEIEAACIQRITAVAT